MAVLSLLLLLSLLHQTDLTAWWRAKNEWNAHKINVWLHTVILTVQFPLPVMVQYQSQWSIPNRKYDFGKYVHFTEVCLQNYFLIQILHMYDKHTVIHSHISIEDAPCYFKTMTYIYKNGESTNWIFLMLQCIQFKNGLPWNTFWRSPVCEESGRKRQNSKSWKTRHNVNWEIGILFKYVQNISWKSTKLHP